MQEEDTFLVVIRKLSWMNLDMKTVKLKSALRSPKEMQVAMETGCGQHLADIWWKARPPRERMWGNLSRVEAGKKEGES